MTPTQISYAALAVAAATALSVIVLENPWTFERRVHDYALNHPKLLEDMSVALQDQKAANEAATVRPLARKHMAELTADPNDPFVGPKDAKVTVVEFFDYRCPICKAATPRVLDMIRRHPDVKFVFKDFPIFGGPSQNAARIAVATWKTKPDSYVPVYAAMMGSDALDEGANDPASVARMKDVEGGILKAQGLDPQKTQALADTLPVAYQVAKTEQLGSVIGLQGTPSFLVGDEEVIGPQFDKIDALIAKKKAAKS
jgi:protein-disulfide isomerase